MKISPITRSAVAKILAVGFDGRISWDRPNSSVIASTFVSASDVHVIKPDEFKILERELVLIGTNEL